MKYRIIVAIDLDVHHADEEAYRIVEVMNAIREGVRMNFRLAPVVQKTRLVECRLIERWAESGLNDKGQPSIEMVLRGQSEY